MHTTRCSVVVAIAVAGICGGYMRVVDSTYHVLKNNSVYVKDGAGRAILIPFYIVSSVQQTTHVVATNGVRV